MKANYWLPHFVLVLTPYALLLTLLSLASINHKPTLKKLITIAFIQASISHFFSYNSPGAKGMVAVVQVVSLVVCFTLVLNLPIKKSIEATLFGISIWGMLEFITAPVLIPLTGILLPNGSLWARVFFFLPKGVICVYIIWLLNKHPLDIYITDFPTKDSVRIYRGLLTKLIVAQTILIVGLVLTNYYDVFDPIRGNFRDQKSLFLTSFIIVYLSFSYFFVKRINFLIKNGIYWELQYKSVEQISDLLQVINIQRHSFKHDLQVIYGLLEVNAIKEATNYVREIVFEVILTSELIRIDNIVLTAFLNTEVNRAEIKNINFTLNITAGFGNLPFDDRDVILILGNLIDNSFDAVENVPKERKLVEVGLHRDLNGYILKVKNCGLPLEKEQKKKIFRPGYTTKSTGSGMGLYSVQRIVKKYKGEIDIISDNESTSFTVHLPNE